MPNIDITDDITDVIPDGGTVDVDDESTPDQPIDSDVDDDAERDPDDYDQTVAEDMGTGGDPIPPDSTPAAEELPEPALVTQTVQTAEYITDYSAASLAEYEQSGAVPYAVYDDGTERQVAWADVSDPSPAGVVAVNEAAEVAAATSQHFWQNSDEPTTFGGAGVHVTDDAKDAWVQAVAAGFPDIATKPWHNILINSLGILLRTGLRNLVSITKSAIAFYDGAGNAASNIVARFGADGAQVGLTDESHLTLDYHSLKMVDKEGHTYLHVSDLRNEDGVAEIVDVFTGDGSTNRFILTMIPKDDEYTASVSDSSGGTSTLNGLAVRFSSAPSNGATITISYQTESQTAKAYTFGERNTGTIGVYSLAEGRFNVASGAFSHVQGAQNEASGNYSHAEGRGTIAHALESHAEGAYTTAGDNAAHAEGYGSVASGSCAHSQNYYTIAASQSQTAIGRYNIEDANNKYAFIVGNGNSDNARSNAQAIRWNGLTDVAGRTAYPLFVYSTAPDESDLPVTPCFVLATGDSKLWYYDGSTAECITPGGDYRRATATVNVGASTIDNWVKGAAMTLPVGVWLLTASAHFPSGGSGTRNCGCCIYSGSVNWEQQRVYSAENKWTALTPCTTVKLSAQTEVSVRVGLSSAANNVLTILNAARIA